VRVSGPELVLVPERGQAPVSEQELELAQGLVLPPVQP
jgi:hypothetical protein